MPVLHVLRPEFDRATAADQNLDNATFGLTMCIIAGLSALFLGWLGFAGVLTSQVMYFARRWFQARQAWKLYYSIAYRETPDAPHD